MVMHEQVTDFMDVLFGETSEHITPGEINFVVPRQREFEQELEIGDMSEFIETGDELSLIPNMDDLLDDNCQVAETIVIETQPTIQTDTPSTSGSIQSEPQFFKFPEVNLTDFINEITESGYQEEVVEDESYLSCSSSQYSPSTIPPTPSTASSVDSNSSHIPSFLKEGLKNTIQSRRMQEGKGVLKVEFREPEPENLTEEEQELRRIRREKNKLAAQKCRSKKRERADILEAETKQLEGTQKNLKIEIRKLLEERDHLMDQINVHKAVCPHLRTQSASF